MHMENKEGKSEIDNIVSEKTNGINNENTKSIIELVFKTGTVLLGLSYFFGFLIVSINYSKYGIVETEIFRMKYIIIGIWFLMPLVIGIIVYKLSYYVNYIGFSPLTDKIKNKTLHEIIDKLIFPFFALISAIFFGVSSIVKIAPQIHINFDTKMILIILHLAFLMNMAYFFGEKLFNVLIKRYKLIEISGNRIVEKKMIINASILSLLMIMIVALPLYMSMFNKYIYNEIPFGMGGGKYEKVVFIIKEDLKEFVYLQTDENNKTVANYKLILETDDSYIIKGNNDKEKSIEIRKDNIVACIRINDEKSNKDKNRE